MGFKNTESFRHYLTMGATGVALIDSRTLNDEFSLKYVSRQR